MNDRDPVLVNSQRRSTSGAKRRGVAFLVVLLALAASSLASIAVLCDASMQVEEAQAVQEAASRHRATQRVLRIRAATPVAIETTTASVPRPESTTPYPSFGSARPSSRHAGGRPDLATPQGAKLHDDLAVAARTGLDARRCAGAVRSLAGMFGTQASAALSGIADDPGQQAEVREVAVKAGRRTVEGSK